MNRKRKINQHFFPAAYSTEYSILWQKVQSVVLWQNRKRKDDTMKREIERNREKINRWATTAVQVNWVEVWVGIETQGNSTKMRDMFACCLSNECEKTRQPDGLIYCLVASHLSNFMFGMLHFFASFFIIYSHHWYLAEHFGIKASTIIFNIAINIPFSVCIHE